MGRKKRSQTSPRPSSRPEPASASASAPVPGWTRQDGLWLGATLIAIGAIYVFTMWPTIAGGDSGELTAVAYSLGVVHPPGYPLWTLLAHLFTYLPMGTVAWRVNLFSVVTSLLALSLLFLVLRRFTLSRWLIAGTTGLIAMSPLIWRYSIAAEVFALNNFFAMGLVYGVLRALEGDSRRWAYGLAFFFGLGLSNHHTLLFVGAPLGAFLLWRQRAQLLTPRVLAILFGLVIFGMTPYLYLFWASARIPLVSWGDISSWQGFLTHFLRREYGTFRLASEGSSQFQLLHGLYYFLLNLGQAFGYVGWIAIGVGGYLAVREKEDDLKAHGARWLVIAPLLYLVVFHSLANLPFVDGAALYRDIVSRFWQMPNLFAAIVFVIGFDRLLTRVTAAQHKALSILIVISPLVACAVHFRHENHRDNTTFADFGRYLLDTLPRNATFFSIGDINTNSIRYLQTCEGYRTDVKVMDRSLMSYAWFKRIAAKHFPEVILPGAAYHPTAQGSFDFKRLFDANYGKQTIYMTMIKTKDSNEVFDKAWEGHYNLMPYGLNYRVLRKDEAFSMDTYIEESGKLLIDPIKAFPRKPLPESWDNVIQANYWLAHHIRAAEILKHAIRTQDKSYFELAEKLLEELLVRNQTPPADYFKNAGIAHQHLMRLTSGEERRRHEVRMIEVWELYVKKTDRRDKTYQDIRSVLKAYGRGQ